MRFKPSTCRQMSNIEAARFAGFFDGEGSVFFNETGRRTPRLQICNSVRAELDWLHSVTGIGSIYLTRAARPMRRTLWTWRVERTADVINILQQVLPYLITKHVAAMDTIAVWLPRLEAAA